MKRITQLLLLLLLCQTLFSQSREYQYVETYVQYVPAVADLSLGMLGVRSDDCFLERFMAMGTALAVNALIVNGILKNVIKEERPDGSAFNSFPSGHTSLAFTGAELVRMDYGWGWGVGAYALATGVAVMRVRHQRHYWWDTVAGAGIGILSAHTGKWLGGLVSRRFGTGSGKTEWGLMPSVDPISGSPVACFALRF